MQWKNRTARRIKLRDLQVLQAVAQTGSMMKAAASLTVTQSAVSKSITEMEHALGISLFDRGARGVVPTPGARVLLKRANAIFDELRQGLEEMSSFDPQRESSDRYDRPWLRYCRGYRRYPASSWSFVTVGDTRISSRPS